MVEKMDVITIDGPSGVGKSTVSRGLAARLGYTYLDTGAMYRAVAYKCQQSGVAVDDERAVTPLLARLDIRVLPSAAEDEDARVVLDGQDISEEIRTPEMGMLASTVSALSVVRQKLTRLQQELGIAGKIVVEGRDTGTVVFPEAAWKFYLDARPEERARRRVEQLRQKGQTVAAEEILIQINKRDRDDCERTVAPLKAAPDAVHVDTTSMDIDQVIDTLYTRVRKRTATQGNR